MDLNIEGKLFPSADGMLVSALVILMMYLIVKKFFWKTITDFLEQRSEYLSNQKNEADKLVEDAIKTMDSASEKEKEANLYYLELMDKAKEDGQKISDDMIKQTEVEIEQMLSIVNKDIKLKLAKMEADFYSKSVDIALQAATKVIEKELDEVENAKLIENFIKQVGEE